MDIQAERGQNLTERYIVFVPPTDIDRFHQLLVEQYERDTKNLQKFYKFSTLIRLLKEGRFHLWIGGVHESFSDEVVPEFVMLACFQDYELVRKYVILWVGGSNVYKYFHLFPVVEDFALHNGASVLTISGKISRLRLLEKAGFKTEVVYMDKQLRPEKKELN